MQQHQRQQQQQVELHVAETMLNTFLQFDHTEMQQQQQIEMESSQVCEEQGHEPPSAEFDKGAVQCWSVDDVVTWLQRHVPFQSERMEECSRAFKNEGIDGLRLLALQKNNNACAGMTDSEWFLLYAARESLLASDGSAAVLSESHPSILNPEDAFLNPQKPSKSARTHGLHTSKSLTLRPPQKLGLLRSSLKFLSFSPRHWWSSSASKHEQKESFATEVYSLQEEILSAEEREAALKARVDHLDEILRMAQLASYLYTRMRWTPLPGELPVDDVDVDDWLQRFLVLEGSTLFFYPQAADLRPQGAILLSEVVEIGAISGHIQHEQGDITWFGFQITTSDGLRFECATPLKLQAELWMSLIQAAHAEQHRQEADGGSHRQEADGGSHHDPSS